MSLNVRYLGGFQFCQYRCGTYIGFSEKLTSSDGNKYKPIEAKTGEVHECTKRRWSDSVSCNGCGKQIIFHNSQRSKLSGKKFPFDFPGNRHNCEKFTGGKN